ncbi:hypothetical protein GCM10027075_28270 [Streptomyces heilongjiangensis]
MPEYEEFLDLAERCAEVRRDTTTAFTDFSEVLAPFPRRALPWPAALGDRVLLGSGFPEIRPRTSAGSGPWSGWGPGGGTACPYGRTGCRGRGDRFVVVPRCGAGGTACRQRDRRGPVVVPATVRTAKRARAAAGARTVQGASSA